MTSRSNDSEVCTGDSSIRKTLAQHTGQSQVRTVRMHIERHKEMLIGQIERQVTELFKELDDFESDYNRLGSLSPIHYSDTSAKTRYTLPTPVAFLTGTSELNFGNILYSRDNKGENSQISVETSPKLQFENPAYTDDHSDVTGRKSLRSRRPDVYLAGAWSCVETLWSIATGQPVWSLDFLCDGTLLVVSGDRLNGYRRGKQVKLPSFQGTAKIFAVATQQGRLLLACIEKNRKTLIVHKQTKGDSLSSASSAWVSKKHIIDEIPSNVAMTPDGDCVFVTGDTYSLLKYNSKGQKSWTRSISSEAYFVHVDMDGRIITTDPTSSKVVVYSDTGTCLAELPAESSQINLLWPVGVCTDSAGRILVADGEKNVVYLFDRCGRFLSDVATVPEGPRDLALYKDTLLAVGTEERGIMVFRVDLEELCGSKPS